MSVVQLTRGHGHCGHGMIRYCRDSACNRFQAAFIWVGRAHASGAKQPASLFMTYGTTYALKYILIHTHTQCQNQKIERLQTTMTMFPKPGPSWCLKAGVVKLHIQNLGAEQRIKHINIWPLRLLLLQFQLANCNTPWPLTDC